METLEKTAAPSEVKAGSNAAIKVEMGKLGEETSTKNTATSKRGTDDVSIQAFSAYYTYRGYGTVRLNCPHAAINSNSRVVASISEYNTDPRLNRFIGNAVMQIYNVAPYNGGVFIRLNVAFGSPLNVRVDVIIES
ncbi:hypothetical protein MTX78_01465 [Hymenobacter tibetensis]|uniref:Uncharacterized protein n=1 Tax=Hymenobacter tibetensis TaxID=497967 RepID=A0ABY4D5L5_9BACT|nr:hypothetical protein [Hymenobacter tibetensis]UOG75278.1 hypothetical protein MTX78_01465 [Hymenobacter tibetensis]